MKTTRMNFKSFLFSALATVTLAFAFPAFAADEKPASAADAALIEKARKTYPLKTCLVSDEALGSMGEAVAHVHRASGQPERVIFLCCEGCIDDFNQEPAKYLKKVDAAAKAPAKGKKRKSNS